MDEFDEKKDVKEDKIGTQNVQNLCLYTKAQG